MLKDEIYHLARQTIRQESRALSEAADQLDEHFIQAIELLISCQGHVLVAGSGTSHTVGARLAHLLTCCGTPALFIHPGDAQHGLSGAVTSKDILFCISRGGETTELNHLARFGRKRCAPIISMTENPQSTLGQLSDIVLKVSSPPEADLHRIIAAGSSLVYAGFGDAICAVLLQLRGYTKEEFLKTHPGGAVGQLYSSERQNPIQAHSGPD